MKTESHDSNFHHLVLDIAWFGLAMAATTRFLSVYAIRLEASPAVLSWMVSLPAIVMMFSSLGSVWWRRRFATSTTAIFLPTFGFRFVFLLPAFTPFLPKPWQPVWLLLSVTLPALVQGISSVIFLDLVREAVHKTYMTALLSRRALAMNGAVALGAISFGIWLEHIRFPVNYQMMFVVAFIAAMMSLWHLMKVQTPTFDPPRSVSFWEPWRMMGFHKVAWIVGVTYITFFSVFAITPLRLVKDLGASEGFMAVFALVELAAAGTVATLTNRTINRIGNLKTVGLGMASTALGSLLVGASGNLAFALPAAVFIGGGWSVVDIGLFGFFSESVPEDNKTQFSTAYYQVLSIGMFLGPMIGNYLASSGLDLATVMFIGAGLRLFASGLAFLRLPIYRGFTLRKV